MTTDQVFDIVMNVRQCSQIPICLMTYLNPVFHYQYDKFFQKCQEVGVDGIIIPDCPYEAVSYTHLLILKISKIMI